MMLQIGNEMVAVVVPWARGEQRDLFLREWNVYEVPDWLVMQEDVNREGCGVTKNAGVMEAVDRGADIVVVLDDDCFPVSLDATTDHLLQLVEGHVEALRPQPVPRFASVTKPPSRGTPYGVTTMTMPVAASMGFWIEVGDYCAVRQLTYGPRHEMEFCREAVFGYAFALCGMNLAFRPAEWNPWCRFIDVSRFDDIWMGWLWQKAAYAREHCFNLNGPLVRHSRQSNVWQNLRDEALHLERSETLWRDIFLHPSLDYSTLRALLPV